MGVIHTETPDWQGEYELIDTGNFRKLERFGQQILIRPEPQAVWNPALSEGEWKKTAHVQFEQTGSHAGIWTPLRKQTIPEQWQIQYPFGHDKLTFRLALTGFKHVGIFPEQAVNWEYIRSQCEGKQNPKVLNLFAYTGGASIAAAKAGAEVTHVDAIRQVVNWASENAKLNQLQSVRWMVEDALKFCQREARRGNQYDGILLDPPAFGHGPKGERWKLEELISEMTFALVPLLKTDGFLVFNTYSLNLSALLLENLLQIYFPKQLTTLSELYLQDQFFRKLPLGIVARL